jgi:parallel beta-helix repeat protein
MSVRILRSVVIALLVAVGMPSQQALATTPTVVVGPSTCRPKYVHFSTIQSAISAVPAGSNILVCPGTYPEQVVITQPVNLSGVTDGTGDAAVITVPPSGLAQNGTLSGLGPVAVQLLVENTVLVTVANLTIDGSGAGCVSGANRVFGLEYYFVGTAVDGTSAGKIQNVVVRNELDTCTLTDGIEIDNSYITLSNNEVHDIDITPIGTRGGQVNISNNNIQNALNGIVVSTSTAANTVTNNTISNIGPSVGFTIPVGVWLDRSNATVTKNTVSGASAGYGVYLPGSTAGANVNGNKVNDTFIGLYLLNSTANTLVQSNTIARASYGIVDVSTGGGNTITKNTVNEAYYGVYVGGPTADTLTPNTFFNVVVTVDPNPFSDPGGTTTE